MIGFAAAAVIVAIAWLAYVYIGYPLLLGVYASARPVRPHADELYRPTVSVLIAARNEEKDIAWKIAETLAWNYPADKLDVWIASDASDDKTDEIVRSVADCRVHFVRIDERGGKNRALNVLAERTGADLLFFTDANAHVGPNALAAVVRHFADPRVGCVTGHSETIRGEHELAVSDGASVYWGYEEAIKKFEDRLGSVLVCDGAVFCMRRDLFVPVVPELANDLELPIRVGAAGYWVLYEPQAVVYERDTTSISEEFARRRRISGQGALGMHKLWGSLTRLRKWQFVSHKALRWLTILPMALMLAGTSAGHDNAIFAAVFVLQMLFYAAAITAFFRTIAGRRSGRLLSIPFYIVLGAVGAFTGVVDSLRGRKYDIWNIPTLSRGSETRASVSAV